MMMMMRDEIFTFESFINWWWRTNTCSDRQPRRQQSALDHCAPSFGGLEPPCTALDVTVSPRARYSRQSSGRPVHEVSLTIRFDGCRPTLSSSLWHYWRWSGGRTNETDLWQSRRSSCSPPQHWWSLSGSVRPLFKHSNIRQLDSPLNGRNRKKRRRKT